MRLRSSVRVTDRKGQVHICLHTFYGVFAAARILGVRQYLSWVYVPASLWGPSIAAWGFAKGDVLRLLNAVWVDMTCLELGSWIKTTGTCKVNYSGHHLFPEQSQSLGLYMLKTNNNYLKDHFASIAVSC